MIRLTKGPQPTILINQAANWTAALLAELAQHGKASESTKGKYRHTDIKGAIVQETHGKCAYCESKLLHSQYGDIEHYVPKSLNPNLAFDWLNLTLACKICNTLKCDRDPMADGIIDPYVTDPETDLDFCGALMFAKNNQGQSTKTVLSLNRAELCERRKEGLERLLSLVENAQNATLPIAARKAIYDDFKARELADDAQYAGMARALHRQYGPAIEAQWAD